MGKSMIYTCPLKPTRTSIYFGDFHSVWHWALVPGHGSPCGYQNAQVGSYVAYSEPVPAPQWRSSTQEMFTFSNASYGGFRKLGYPPIIHFLFGFSIINHPASWGYPHDLGKHYCIWYYMSICHSGWGWGGVGRGAAVTFMSTWAHTITHTHTHHATLLDLLLHLRTHTHVIRRSAVFSCTLWDLLLHLHTHTHTSCYALGPSLALAQTWWTHIFWNPKVSFGNCALYLLNDQNQCLPWNICVVKRPQNIKPLVIDCSERIPIQFSTTWKPLHLVLATNHARVSMDVHHI